MLSTYTTPPPPRLPSPLPLRKDSLSGGILKQPKLSSPLAQSREDAKCARIVLAASVADDEDKAGMQLYDEERARQYYDRTRELAEMLDRMTSWVEELATLLQQTHKNQTELETALTLARSNLQLALANNEMLEEALKRGGGGGQDVGWRRWSEREGVRRSGSVKEYIHPDRPNSVPDALPLQQQHQQSAPSRFFNFKSSLQRISSNNTSPTATSASPPYASASASASVSTSSLLPSITLPSSSRSQSPAPSSAPLVAAIATSGPSSRASSPSPTPITSATPHLHSASRSQSQSTQPTPREKELTSLLNKERAALKALADAKTQLEEELESLSQALFEEANKMVSKANRKLAETEEELRIATEQKEALQGALRIVEGENGALRRVGGREGDVGQREEQSTASEAVEQHLTGADAEQAQGDEKGMDALRPDDEDRPDPSHNQLQQLSQSLRTPSHNLTHPVLSQDPPPIPAVTATVDTKGSIWSSMIPLSDSEEVEERNTLKSSSRPLTSPLQIPPVQASSTVSTSRSLNPNPPSLTSTKQLMEVGPHATPIHRWSVLSATPGSRTAVRSEFEDAMRRMRELVGEAEGEEDEEGDGVNDGVGGGNESERVIASGPLGEKTEGDAEVERADGDVNPWRI